MDVVDKINADGSASTSSTGTPAKLHRMVSVTIAVTSYARLCTLHRSEPLNGHSTDHPNPTQEKDVP